MSIKQHNFYDDDVTQVEVLEDDLVEIELELFVDLFYINKSDAIALAKHFGLKAKDIRKKR